MSDLAIAMSRSDDRGASAETAAGVLPRLRFGDALVHLPTAGELALLRRAHADAGAALIELPGPYSEHRLRVVIQKGRLFQRAYPDVPVLLDKGRFLLVDLDENVARQIDAADEAACFSLRALGELETLDGERVVYSASGRAPPQPPDPKVRAFVDRLSITGFEADLKHFTSMPTRLSTSDHFAAACGYAEQRLSAAGYEVSRQPIKVRGRPSANVVARRAGAASGAGGMVLVTAHLDSINIEGGALAPGADDDGSGSAGTLEMARALRDKQSLHDLVFVLFGGEEQGLHGSKHFVRELTAIQRARVRAVVNMDMIGALNTAMPTVLLEGRPLSRHIIEALAKAAATYTTLAVETSLNAANSDHVSFLDMGLPAVLTIEGADSTNDNIHSGRDTIDRINAELAIEILRMNTALVAETLDGE